MSSGRRPRTPLNASEIRVRSTSSQVKTASPEMLQLMLWDGAIRFAEQGKDALLRKAKPAAAAAKRRRVDGMKNAGGEVWATECPLAAIQFEQHAGVKPMHPMSILARAYRTDGFPRKVEPAPVGARKETA